MEQAVDMLHTSSAAMQTVPTSTGTSTEREATLTTAAAVNPPEIRRSIRVQQRSSVSPQADRLLHRTSSCGVGSPTSTRSGRRTIASKAAAPNATSVNQRTVSRANVDVSTNNNSNNNELQTDDTTSQHLNAISVSMNSPSDEEPNGNIPSNRLSSSSTRLLVLENFMVEKDGYRCKICNEVCSNVNKLVPCGCFDRFYLWLQQ
jgi:hypothetical protein